MIVIPEPDVFHSQLDEDHFFGWLNDIPAVKSVTMVSEGLQLDIGEPIDRVSFQELASLLTRYDLDRRCLKPLAESNPDPWLRDPVKYWHDAVFGD
jgi:hypothetical protein